jgi:predicted dehydrogenase
VLEAAVIGCGFQGKLHLEILARLGVEIAGICDVSAERLEQASAEFGVTSCFTHYQDLLAECRPNLVSVCTMPNTHRDLCIAALNAGAHVLCEKPLALNVSDATEIVAAAKATGKDLFVGFNMRFTDSGLAVKQLIDEGRLGLPVCARGYMLADEVPWWGPHFVREVSGGGALAATAVHMLDLVWWLVGRPRPVTATASMATLFPKKRGASAEAMANRGRYNTEDIIFGHVRFENGFWMSIEGSWIWNKPGWNYGFDLIGEKAQAHFDPLEIIEETEGHLVDITNGRPAGRDMTASLAREIEEVVSAISRGTPASHIATASEALVTQSLVDALYASAEAGREVPVVAPAL